MNRGNWTDNPCWYVSVQDAGRTALVPGPFRAESECRQYAYQKSEEGGNPAKRTSPPGQRGCRHVHPSEHRHRGGKLDHPKTRPRYCCLCQLVLCSRQLATQNLMIR